MEEEQATSLIQSLGLPPELTMILTCLVLILPTVASTLRAQVPPEKFSPRAAAILDRLAQNSKHAKNVEPE